MFCRLKMSAMLSICLLVSVATSTSAEHPNGWVIELSIVFQVAWLGVLRLNNLGKTNRLLRELEVALLWPISSYLDLQNHHRCWKCKGLILVSPDISRLPQTAWEQLQKV